MKEVQVDTVIVGAGLAGLSAAYELKKAGKSVAVLEARDRVGGRTMEGSLLGQSFDLGGQWVGPTQKKIMALIKELGLETFPQHASGYQLVEMKGKLARYKGVIP
ncbi:MAG: FAD-dependent oxidoreductase, partial [Leptospiraceae bacterium]|nr:FAD-dependent oxidoreductase [Leptospiraceae bacterium]